MVRTKNYIRSNFSLRLVTYKPYPCYKVRIHIFATGQAVYLFQQILKTDFRRDRRKSVFACWWHSPQTPFRRISFCGYAPFRRFFLSPPAEIFRKRRDWPTSIIANCPVKGNDIFSKIRQARRAAASVKRCSKGLGCFPTSKTCGFRHRREPQVLSVCIYRRPACHLYQRL